MEFFEERGLDYVELCRRIKMKYGNDVTIMTSKREMMGGFLGIGKREGWVLSGYIGVNRFKENFPERAEVKSDPDLKFEEEKSKMLRKLKNDPSKEVLDVLNRLEKKMDGYTASGDEKPENIRRMEELLENNDFSRSYIERISALMEKNISFENLKNWSYTLKKVRDWIKEDIVIYKEKPAFVYPKIVILIGPTGVGKTTTVAKLAANAVKKGENDVRIITIDKYRIGADKQIEALAEIMHVPVASIGDCESMRKQINLWSGGPDLIFVDTIGRSPNDPVEIASMKTILDACGTSAEKYLAVSAATKLSSLFEIMQQFEIFGYNSLIFTKMDETSRAGSLISALYEKHKSVSYITTGQRIPTNIEYADGDNILEYLEGFDTV